MIQREREKDGRRKIKKNLRRVGKAEEKEGLIERVLC